MYTFCYHVSMFNLYPHLLHVCCVFGLAAVAISGLPNSLTLILNISHTCGESERIKERKVEEDVLLDIRHTLCFCHAS